MLFSLYIILNLNSKGWNKKKKKHHWKTIILQNYHIFIKLNQLLLSKWNFLITDSSIVHRLISARIALAREKPVRKLSYFLFFQVVTTFQFHFVRQKHECFHLLANNMGCKLFFYPSFRTVRTVSELLRAYFCTIYPAKHTPWPVLSCWEKKKYLSSSCQTVRYLQFCTTQCSSKISSRNWKSTETSLHDVPIQEHCLTFSSKIRVK